VVSTEVVKKSKMVVYVPYRCHSPPLTEHYFINQVQNTNTNMAAQISKKRKVRMPCHYCHRPTAVVVVAMSQLNARFGGRSCVLDPRCLSQ